MAYNKKGKKKAVTDSPVATDTDWQAQGDADTLIRSQEIMADKRRKQAATKCLSERAAASVKAVKQAGGNMSEYMKKATK